MTKVHIITGKINCGKTSKLLKIYDQLKKGDGFVSIKNMNGDLVIGYDIMQLSSKQKLPFVLHEEHATINYEVCCKIGPYNFSKVAIKHMEKTIKQLVKNNVSPIFLDEVGQLELDGKCFNIVLKELISNETELYITVREDLVNKIIKRYDIKSNHIIREF